MVVVLGLPAVAVLVAPVVALVLPAVAALAPPVVALVLLVVVVVVVVAAAAAAVAVAPQEPVPAIVSRSLPVLLAFRESRLAL